MSTLISRFLDGGFNHIIPMSFILLAVIAGTLIFTVRYSVYRRRRKKYARTDKDEHEKRPEDNSGR